MTKQKIQVGDYINWYSDSQGAIPRFYYGIVMSNNKGLIVAKNVISDSDDVISTVNLHTALYHVKKITRQAYQKVTKERVEKVEKEIDIGQKLKKIG